MFLGDSSNRQAANDLANCGGYSKYFPFLRAGRIIYDGLPNESPFNFSGAFATEVKNNLNAAVSEHFARTIIVANFGLHYEPMKYLDRFIRDIRGFSAFILDLLSRQPNVVVLWHGCYATHFDTVNGEYAPSPRSLKCVAVPQPDVSGNVHSAVNASWRDRGPRDEVKRLNHPDVYFLPLGRLTKLVPPSVHPGYPDCTHLCKTPFAWEALWWAVTELTESYANRGSAV
jgi:hypothetical protein